MSRLAPLLCLSLSHTLFQSVYFPLSRSLPMSLPLILLLSLSLSLSPLSLFLVHNSIGTNIARALAALPPNILNPSTYSTHVIKEFASAYDWEMTEWMSDELKLQGTCGIYYFLFFTILSSSC